MTQEYTACSSGNPVLGLKPEQECYQCFCRGFRDYVSRAGLSDDHYEIYISNIHRHLDMKKTPPLAGAEAWALLREQSLTTEDIFAGEKAAFTKKMLSVYDQLRRQFSATEYPAGMALMAATWCNLLDVGQGVPLPGTEELVRTFSEPLAVDRIDEFLGKLDDADVLLILGDNAGETVLDRLFLELSGFKGQRYFMTREKPVMNDALVSDAEAAGLHLEATIISSGTDMPSTIPELLNGKPGMVFDSADVILAKGQGNLEGLFGLNDPRVYHSFVVKCPVIARATGFDSGSGVFCSSTDLEG